MDLYLVWRVTDQGRRLLPFDEDESWIVRASGAYGAKVLVAIRGDFRHDYIPPIRKLRARKLPPDGTPGILHTVRHQI